MPELNLQYTGLIGQENVVARLIAFIEVFASSAAAPGHILLIGNEGMGQTTIAMMVANEIAIARKKQLQNDAQYEGTSPDGATKKQLALCRSLGLVIPSGATREMVSAALDAHFAHPSLTKFSESGTGGRFARPDCVRFAERDATTLRKVDELVETVKCLGDRPVVLLSNLNRVRKQHQRGLRGLMREGKPFTLIATCPRKSECPGELLNEFSLVVPIQPYSNVELQTIAVMIGKFDGVLLEPEAAELIARASDGKPSNVASMLRRTAQAVRKAAISEEDVERAFTAFGIAMRSDALSNEVDRIRALSGQDFERLIKELLTRMGFEAEMTRTTGDGGIDIIATLNKPILGGLYLFQCKRFAAENLVGAPMVRDFYGAVMADRAVKGVFITTSSYTAQAREFAEKAGLELIDLARLERLVQEYGLTPQEEH